MWQTLKDLGPVKLAIIAAVAILLPVFFTFLIIKMAEPQLSPLYSGLAVEDSAKIVTELESAGIPYKITANGTQILAPADQIYRLRLKMAEQGLPSNGSMIGYEIFDKSNALGTSNFINDVNLLRALEGEIARTISAMDIVEQARVHLVMPRKELFLKNKQEPSASIVLKLRGATEISDAQIAAISNLVAGAVPGLKPNKITIIDSSGKPMKLGGEDENSSEYIAAKSENFRIHFEDRMKKVIEELLEQSVGMGKVKAQVNADLNFDRVVTNSEIYDPEGKVERSVQASEENEKSSEGGADTVSVTNNLPGGQSQQGGAKNISNNSKIDEITNYEISKTVKNLISETGTVQKLSIAVLVDGIYNTNAETGEKTYIPRSEEELAKLKNLVASAVGMSEERGDKIEIVNMQFVRDQIAEKEETPLDWIKRDLHALIQTAVLGIVSILVILLVIRPLVSKAFERTRHEDEEEIQNAFAGKGEPVAASYEDTESESAIDIEMIEEKMKTSSIKTLNDIITKHPEETLSILRTWLSKEPG